MKRAIAASAACLIIGLAVPAVGHDGDRKHDRIHRLKGKVAAQRVEIRELRSQLDNASVNIASLLATIEERNQTIQELRGDPPPDCEDMHDPETCDPPEEPTEP